MADRIKEVKQKIRQKNEDSLQGTTKMTVNQNI